MVRGRPRRHRPNRASTLDQLTGLGRCESHRPHELCPSVSLRVFTVREGEGSSGNLRGSNRRKQENPRKGPGQTLRATLSQCRGRGFESLHLHKSPGQRAKVGSPEGHEALLSATSFVVEVEDASWPHSPKNQVISRQPDLRHGGRCDWAPRVFTCLYRQSLVLQKPMNSGRVEVAYAITEQAMAVSIDVLLSRMRTSIRPVDRAVTRSAAPHTASRSKRMAHISRGIVSSARPIWIPRGSAQVVPEPAIRGRVVVNPLRLIGALPSATPRRRERVEGRTWRERSAARS